MKIIVDRNKLNEALANVEKGVNINSPKQALQGILITMTNKRMEMMSTTGEFGVRQKIEVEECDEDGCMLVNAKLFGDFIKKVPKGLTLTMTYDEEKRSLNIKSGKIKVKIACKDASEYPEDVFEKVKFEMSLTGEKFAQMVKNVSFAVDTTGMKPILSGCLLKFENQKCSLTAIDGYRLSMQSAEVGFMENEEMVIPGANLEKIAKMFEHEDEVELGQNLGQVMFKSKNLQAFSSTLEGDFIKVKDILDTGNKNAKRNVKVDVGEFKSVLERVSLFANSEENKLIKMTINENIMKVVVNSELGDAEEELEVEETMENEEELTIGFNCRYLLDYLKRLPGGDINMKFGNCLQPCIATYDEDMTYLILPVRVA